MPLIPTLNSHQKRRLAYAVALAWLIIVGACFWFFSGRWMQPFGSAQTVNFSAGVALPTAPAPTGSPLIVHFLDRDCPCNRFAEPQVSILEERHDPTSTSVRIYASDSRASQFDWVPASPAVAIWNAEGELAYLGPHSAGAFCGQGESLVDRVMHQLLFEGSNPKWLNWQAVGCFCPW